MQIIESSALGVRSARARFTHPRGGPSVTLFPMVHIGEPAFYRTVFDDAYAHDIVLIEGLNSPITTRVTRSYRWLIGSDRIGLSLQPHGPKAGACNATIVDADLSV